MKPSLMWPSARPNSAVNIQAVCPRLGVQDAMARPWSTSIKSHSPPVGRYVHHNRSISRNERPDILDPRLKSIRSSNVKIQLPSFPFGCYTNPFLWRWSRTSAWRKVREVMTRAGIEGPQATSLGLRHGFGVIAVECDVPLTLLQQWMGHASIEITASYAQTQQQDAHAFAARMWSDSTD